MSVEGTILHILYFLFEPFFVKRILEYISRWYKGCCQSIIPYTGLSLRELNVRYYRLFEMLIHVNDPREKCSTA